jgi:phospho-N-acetylmuramoyl-pentapeptide-transferase
MSNMVVAVDIVKILIPSATAFFIGVAMTPIVAHYLYKFKLWKKHARTEGLGGGGTPIFNKLHKDKEVGTPRMGGIIIWATVFITTLVYLVLSIFFDNAFFDKLNFFSNNQTLLPLVTLAAAAGVGLIDDMLQVMGRGGYIAGGLSLSRRIFLVLLIGLLGSLWFYVKLERSALGIPFFGEIDLGILFIPFFMILMLSLFSGGVIDGIDGLAAGVLSSVFAAYSGIAFFQNQIDIAALSGVFAGAILAFLWFNIPPARFYMGETGMMGLTASLAVIIFLTRAELPVIVVAFPLYLASFSVILQVASKKLRGGRKIFLVAPIHHHFEALGWPGEKVTMRFWIVGVVFAIVGMIIALVG